MKKAIIITIVSVAIVAVSAVIYGVLKGESTSYTPQQNLDAPIEIPDTAIVTIQEANNIDKPQVAMFYVDWCTYCRRFMPKFGEIAKKYSDKYTFTVINCDNPENKEIVEKFHIMGFPALFVIDNEVGHNFSMHMGATVNNDIMIEELDNYLAVREKFLNKQLSEQL